MVRAFYLKNAYWEISFFINEILIDGLVSDTVFFNEKNPPFVDSNDIGNNILIVNDSYSFEKVEKLVKKIKPLMIFHLSDETGSHGHWASLSQHTKYYFRHHYHNELKKYPNAFQFPLGYGPGYLKSNSIDIINNGSIKSIRERSLEWAFVGTIKYDRHEMCSKFGGVFKNGRCITGNNPWDEDTSKLVVHPSDMADIYRDAIFAPNGRGNISLDCFRVYEAIVCGAIPVVIGTDEEINRTFWYGGHVPIFVRGSNWDEAVYKCRELMEHMDDLETIQKTNLNWWKQLIGGYRDMIHDLKNQN
jgi:hypothetical protein